MIPDVKSNGVMELINRILASIKEQGKRQRAKEALKNILGGCESKVSYFIVFKEQKSSRMWEI
jgi:hypothetical protein